MKNTRKYQYACLAILAGAFSVSAHANYGMGGCGLGSIIFRDNNGFEQVFAVTTNSIYSNHTSGMTSGTSNCTENSGRVAAETFITINRVALEKEAARGDGESMNTLAQVLKCDNAAAFSSAVNGSFQEIFGEPGARSQEVLQKMESALKSNTVATKCAVFS